jgi:hypothetical protein
MSGRSTTLQSSGGTGVNHRGVSQDDIPAEFRTGHRLNVSQKQCRLRQFTQYKKKREKCVASCNLETCAHISWQQERTKNVGEVGAFKKMVP